MKYVILVFAVLCAVAFVLDLFTISIILQVTGVPTMHSWTIPVHQRAQAIRQYQACLIGLVILPAVSLLSLWMFYKAQAACNKTGGLDRVNGENPP